MTADPPDAVNAPFLSCRSTAATPASSASTTAACPFFAAMYRGDRPAQWEGPVQQWGGGGHLSKDRHTMRWRTTPKATNAGSPEQGVGFDDYAINYKSSIRISSRHNSDDNTKWYIHSLKINSAATHCCFTPHIVVSHTTHLTH